MTNKEHSWIIRSKPHPKLRLFCFPYAGGGASIFRLWSEALPEEVEVCPVYLPGRENRFLEPAFTDMHSLVEALTEELIPSMDIPFAFFGHSMGGKISYTLARSVRAHYGCVPAQLFVSAIHAPQLPLKRTLIHTLPDAEFLAEIFRFGGTPEAVVQNRELMELLIPLLRADFTLYETYVDTPDTPFSCPIAAFYGEQDTLTSVQELAAWREQTTSTFTLAGFPGNHFFLHSAQDAVLRVLSQHLTTLLKDSA